MNVPQGQKGDPDDSIQKKCIIGKYSYRAHDRTFGSPMRVSSEIAGSRRATTDGRTKAGDVLNKGVQDFKNGQYDAAISAFERAKELNPQFLNARLYLATAYAARFFPGAPSEANRERGRRAVEEFRGVLEIDPENLSAIDGIGSILFQSGYALRFREVSGIEVVLRETYSN